MKKLFFVGLAFFLISIVYFLTPKVISAQSCPSGGLAECGIIEKDPIKGEVCNPSGAYHTTCYSAGGQCKMSTDRCHGLGQCVGTDPCSGTGGAGAGAGGMQVRENHYNRVHQKLQ